MQNLRIILLISLRLYFCQIISTCELFSDNPLDCIEKTSGYSCNYNYFESKCIVEKKTSQGCIETLNLKACINQLTNYYGEETKCTFNKKCELVLKQQLQTQGCLTSYNKYACLNVVNADCQWENSQCQPLEEILETAHSCEESYLNSVTYVTCSKLQNLLCMSSGFKGDYGCVTVQDEQLKTLQCTQIGLTKRACVSIQTDGEECIFKDQMCQTMEQSEITSCLMDLNRQGCLSIKNPYISCKWIENSCYSYKQTKESNTDDLREVNISVCQSIKGLYKYDRENAKCIEIDDFKDITCTTLGLSKEACIKVRNQNCIFYEGTCQELNEQDLKTYSCNMDLNEMGCINLETEFQYCKWNGNKCERIFMNQDLDCPLNFEDESMKVNGNVCQAISKPNVLCKYDQKTNLCINSTPDDDCDTPFINQKGCNSIDNVKNKQTCKWINYKCISVQIISYFTTCESLQYANPQACSQVFENNSVGCYYDQIQQKCVTLLIKLQNDSQKDQQKLDLQFLNSISCENTSLGLNRVACGSITTNGVACMWKQDKCVFIEKKAMISAVPCLNLQWANARACNYAEFQKEICRYDVDQVSCVTTAKDHMKCEEIGLNRYGCMIAEGFCYFNEELSLCLNDPSSNISEKLSCDTNSPSKPMCLSITKKGENCIWQPSSGKCAKANIPFNSNCLTLSYQMNANTCTLIEMSFPDYNIDASKDKSLTLNYGYCKYNQSLNTCQIKNDKCKTKCCTDIEDIGINAHSCSRYSSQAPDVYCYFDEGRCKELTSDIANVLDPEAVKSYYNFKQFKCSQMNINSCSMIEWSTTQRCVHLGNSCFSINLKEYSSLKDLTEESTITNKYTCFAIESESLVDKYFTFDEVNRRCKSLTPESETPFAKCEDAIGNRNLCLRYTGNNYCKWNSDSLKCETIMNYVVDKIEACDANLNIKACIENKVNPCYFSFGSDKCQQAPKDVECNYFDDKGKISEKVCKLISKKGQKCQFKDNLCATFETYQNVCAVNDANQIACYNNVNGNCRWDGITLQCYENLSDISTLNCSSNLNKILCLQVVKEPCHWNADDLQCQRFNVISDVEFKKLNSGNSYTKDACSLITGSGYIYKSDKCEVLPDTSNINDCSDYWMNEYACLYLTKGHKCFYDVTEEQQRKKCKPFQGEYSQCSDENSQILINIEICMNIPKACAFEQSSLRCVNVEIGPQEKCSKLADSIKEKKYYNKLACSSINPESIDNFGSQQCYQNQESFQNCLYEKYCFWDQLYYSCSIFVPVLTYFDKYNWVKKQLKVCLNQNSQIEQFTDGCSYQIRYQSGFKFVGQQQIQLPLECSKTNSTCKSDDDCIPYQTTNIQLDYVIGKMKVTFPTNNTQTCQGRCGFQGQKTNFCNEDSDCGQEYITRNNIQFTDLQKCRVMKRRWHYVPVYTTYSTTVLPKDYYSCTSTTEKIDDTTITTYQVTILEYEVAYDPIKEEDCQFDDKKCYCQYTSEPCQYDTDCPRHVNDNLAYGKKCGYQDYYFLEPYCISKIREIEKCENIYSEALCLEYVKQRCYFDINQGGCIQLEDNQDKLPQCNSMTMDSCLGSKTKKVACSKGEKSAKPGDSCFSIIKQFNDCKETLFYNSFFTCPKVKKEDGQSSLCARATDECRFSGSECVNQPDLDDTGACKCDSSYSQTLCEKCNCDFSFLGFCQQTKQTLQYDANIPYSLCYRINLLDLRDVKSKQQACASVAQACKFIDSCEDATHITCDDMLGSMVVSLKACQKCKDQPAQYDPKKLFCLALNDDTLINQCQYLNKISCLKNARNVNCKWDQTECKEISIASNDKVDCSTLNYDACYQKQQNQCWFDPYLKQCTEFNPFKALCEFVQDQQSLCNQSMAQNCVWENSQCTKKDKILPNICKGLNKYACLNQQLVPCGWSINQECVELISIINYTNFLQSAQSNSIIQNNAQACSLISEYKNYLIDEQFKCREVIEIDLIYCNTPGINQKSCVQLSIGKCKYYNSICQITNEVNLGCQSYLNKEACLSQKAQCKFTDKCEQFLNPILSEILQQIDYSYSDYVCLTVDLQTKPSTSLVFLSSKGQCIDISDQEPTISDCQLRGMNINACLQKTKQQCEYLDNQCQSVSLASQSTCSQTLNWFACTESKAQCKFVNARCQSLLPTDTCEQLEQLQAIVNEIVCVKTTDVPCKYDINTRGCSKVNSNQNCSISGLNEKSCIFYTNGQDCKYEMNQCTPYYAQAKCTDKINKDKCLNLRDRQQNCKFDSTLGCIQIISESDLKTCLKNFQTNPSTCSQATDFPCYYNFDTNMCQIFSNPSQFETPSRSQDWQNRVSFNILTCQMYDIDQRKTLWDDGCKETTDTQLSTLECKDQLNYYTCVNLKTPLQYCQYINNICYEKDWFTYKDQQCQQVKNVNNGNFCQATTDVECMFDIDNKNCIKLVEGETIQCQNNNQVNLGYNEKACAKSNNCIFIDNRCQQFDENNLYYCSQVQSIEYCKNVLLEGCYRNSQQKCQVITSQLQKQLNCSDIENQVGCKQLQTKGQYCRYYDNKCQNEKIQDYKIKNCKDIKLINNYEFCEQTQDIECTYDPLNNSCIEQKQEQQDLTCPRGLNKLACIPLNSNSNQCQFFNYCYGQNSDILNCNINDEQCCQKAQTIQSCLFQTKFKCQWNNNNNKCIQYNQQINQQIQCNTIQNASRNVCYSLLDQFCIFDHLNFQCTQIIPLNCDSVQSAQQCKRIPKIACYWNQDQCQQKQQDLSDTCQYISEKSGSHQACIQIQRSGQMCIFNNYQCLSFLEIQNTDNCLDNINQNACLQQTISQCYWDLNVESDENSPHKYCKFFEKFDSSKCEQNLSYLSCLNIVTANMYCQWINEKCESVKIDINNKLVLESYSNVNGNVCRLITDPKPMMYDSINRMCSVVTDFNQLTCNQGLMPINMYACIKIKNELCVWDYKTKICKVIANQKMRTANQEAIIESTCQVTGRTPISCSLLEVQLPCGGGELGCDYVKLKTVQCNHIGLNKYACLNLTSQSCKWVVNKELNIYQCQEHTPFGLCSEQPEQVNAMLCSLVGHKDPCAYDQISNSCKWSSEHQKGCATPGINQYGCAQIENCVFLEGRCLKYSDDLNLSCQDAEKAHYTVCAKITKNQCKYSELKNGCVSTDLFDSCQVLGINQLGCNAKQPICQWIENNCECVRLFEEMKPCSQIQDSAQCQLRRECYYNDSFPTKISNELIKSGNQGSCKEKGCSDREQCEGEIVYGYICYMDKQGICQSAHECQDIKNAVKSCSSYVIQDRPCVEKEYKDDNVQCETLLNCQQLDIIACQKNLEYCIYGNDLCTNKQCVNYMDEISCPKENCFWKNSKKRCLEQVSCELNQSEKECSESGYANTKCGWFKLDDQPSFCRAGCRYLPQAFTSCKGTQIAEYVCVNFKDVCIQCEEITDPCHCLEEQDFCHYDIYRNKCYSKGCQIYNQETCPASRCTFNQEKNVCIPQCRFRFNIKECGFLNDCIWDQQLKQCLEYQENPKFIDICPGCLKAEKYLAIILLIISLSAII